MKIPEELTVFLSPESTPVYKRQFNGIGSTANNNRSRIPFIVAFAVGVPIILALAVGTWWYRTKRRRAYFAGNRQPAARGNQSWGKRRVNNVRASGGGLRGGYGGYGGSVEPPPPVYTGAVANTHTNVPGLSPQQVGGSNNEAPPSYTDATASEEGRARV